MSLPRIYTQTPLHTGETILLDPSAQRHAIQVLRLKAGASLQLFDGSGQEFLATIGQVSRRETTATLQQPIEPQSESPLQSHLYQGISKGERMDYAIQKAVELGVSEITPLFCERSVVRLDAKRLQRRLEHWHGVIISACEQCGRSRLPTLHPGTTLQQVLEREQNTRFLLNPMASSRLADYPERVQQCALLIGPEGGLSAAEINQAEASGWLGVRLGPRVLRTETATVVALTTLQQCWGDL
jgi:16S rRNA (uracil1498-N3)-methyltransferase